MCSIIDPIIRETIPKCLDNLSDINMNSSTIEKKRKASSYNIAGIAQGEKNIRTISSYDSSSDSNENSNESSRNLNNPSKVVLNLANPTTEISNDFSSLLTGQNYEDELTELDLDKIYDKASNGFFQKKLFIFKDCKKWYSERLHFFKSIRKFDNKWDECKEPIAFTCKICQVKHHCSIGSFSNLNQHLKTHQDFRTKWLKFFDQKNNYMGTLDNDTYDLIRGIISANISLNQLENENFARCLRMEITSVRTFRYDRLPKAYELLKDLINKKLNEAITICLITDIWTNIVIADFIALCAMILNKNHHHEFLVIGMTSMPGNHTAENIKKVLEYLING